MTAVNYLWRDEEGNIRIRADEAFSSIYPSISKDIHINQVSEEIKKIVIKTSTEIYGSQPSSGSLNNCKGRWNEFSFLYSSHISILNQRQDLYLVKMGGESSIKFWELYTPSSRKNFEIFLGNLSQKGVALRCSTPDFTLINRDLIRSLNFFDANLSFDYLNTLYKSLINQCEPNDIIAFISIKTSNRPDRRYQILYEANITKLASKFIHSPDHPLQFHVIGTSTKSDADVFTAPLLASVFTQVIEHPVIDSDVQISTIQELDQYWSNF